MSAPPRAIKPVLLWRCVKCGKWSHAVRRPSKHKIGIHHETDYGASIEFVSCGPFSEWAAYPSLDLEAKP